VREDLPYPKQRLRLPVVLSPEDVQRLIASAKRLYHRTLLLTRYGAGLRRSEVCQTVKVLRRVFRGKFVDALRRAYTQDQLDLSDTEPLRAPAQWHAFVDALFQTDWVVYAKPAFGGASASCATSDATPIASRSAIIDCWPSTGRA